MTPPDPIAVVGMAGAFPGAATLEAFWEAIEQGRSASAPVPADRWPVPADELLSPAPVPPDRLASLRACLLGPEDCELGSCLEGTPLQGAGIERLDPAARLALRVGIEAWRSAKTADVDLARVGVVLANIALPTEESSRLARGILGRAFEGAVLGADAPLASDTTLGTDPRNRYVCGLPAGLLGRALGLGGGGFTLDAACASSLYALHLACEELRAGRLDAVLAGGVSRPDSLYTQVGFSQLRALSPSGVCAPFSSRADGLVVGEGAGIFVLKRLGEALAAGDVVHGVIRAVGLSNDVGGSLLSPESEGQRRAMAQAYERAGWSPSDVDLVECHGTGTPRGDAVEAASLAATWGGAAGPCVLGSVKSNVGHLLTAAGAAGFMKVLLALRHRTLPPTANADGEPIEALSGTPFAVLSAPRPWADPGRPRRAAVSGFGFGGINAHLLVEEHRDQRIEASLPAARGPIAVVGLGARFGPLDGIRAFAEATLDGRSALGPVPPGRWRGLEGSPWIRSLVPDLAQLPGAWIDALSLPIGRFKLPPNEIPATLPQQLLMLQVAAAAAEDAGLPAGRGGGPLLRTGVVVGLGQDLEATGFHLGWLLRTQARRWAELRGVDLDPAAEDAWVAALQEQLGPRLDASRTLGALGGIVASRVARELRLGGPSFAVSSEEASGLRALEVAVRLLQRGEVDRMLVGAVDLAGDLRAVLSGDALRSWTRTSPQPFGAGADGPAVGEGAAAVVLKRLDDAVRDGDTIYGVVRGIGAAQDRWSTAFARAAEEAGFGVGDVGLIEAAGSGEGDEDAAELEAIAGACGGEARGTALAAVRACVGDPGAAGGLASLVRGLLALHHRAVPGWPGFRPADDVGALHVPEARRAWLHDRSRGPRRLAVHARSADGARVQALLEEAPAGSPRPASTLPRAAGLFLAWGADDAALDESVGRLRRLCAEAPPSAPAHALAERWFAQEGAPPAGARVRAVASTDAAGARRRLEQAAPPPIRGDVAFVYPGSGAHHLGMGTSLLADLPEVHDALDGRSEHLAAQHADAAAAPRTFGRPRGWRRAAEAALEADPLGLIFAHVSHGVAVTEALLGAGARPQAAVGYSLGESTALLALGAWPDRDRMWRDVSASPLFREQLAGERTLAAAAWGTGEDWSVAVLPAPATAVRAALQGTAALLIVNAPGECVVGGRRPDVEATADAVGARATWLGGVPTVHCPLVEPVGAAYRALHRQPTTSVPGLRFYSGHAAAAYEVGEDACADALVASALHGLDFAATVQQAWDDGVRVFVECGPGSSCSRMIGRTLGDRPHRTVAADRAGVPGSLALFEALAVLAEAGQAVDVAALYAGAAPEAPPSGPRVEVVLGGPRPAPPPLEAFLARRVTAAPSRPRVHASSSPLSTSPPPSPPPGQPPRRSPSAAPEAAAPSPWSSLLAGHAALLQRQAAASAETAAAHGAFLDGAQRSMALATQLLARTQALAAGAPAPSRAPTPRPAAPAPPTPVLDRAQCLEFAVGSVGSVLGPMFAPADAHPTRVRLPDEPLMLVDRIVALEGEPGSMGSGRVVTEHDVLPGAWYLDGGRAPVCISVEAGQADLFLSGWLGIDLQTKGERVYRLLDARVTFWRDLPRVGEVVRYDIRIDRFIRQGSTWLFFFRFEGWIGDEHLITMEDGCAGFFSAEQLATGRGLVDELPTEPPPRRVVEGRPTAPFVALVPLDGGPETLDDAAVDALRSGDLHAAFGPMFAGRRLAPELRLPGDRMKLVHRVTTLDPRGGTFGLGLVIADTDVDPQAWYLTCHFVDDRVMPGTLMYEGCLHTLRVLLLRLGWAVEDASVGDVHGAPIDGVGSALRCRGQVIESTKTLTYELHVKELGYDPAPYVLADAVMYADGKRVVSFANVSYRVPGLDEAALVAASAATPSGTEPWERRGWGMAPLDPAAPPAPGRPAIYGPRHILAFAVGRPSDAFGPPYRPFDADRRIARLPGPPFCFLDRVVHVEPEPWALQPGGWIEAEYDAPPDAWYHAANRSRSMPFAVILETALQPCGWLAAYLGSALRADVDVHFRNLEGEATLHRELRTDCGTLTVRVRLTGCSEAGGMIIQTFDMQLWQGADLAYDGWTRFGFFPTASLKNQVGIRDAGARLWRPEDPGDVAFDLPRLPPLSPDACGPPPSNEDLSLPAGALQTIDRVAAVLDRGGPQGLGWIRGTFDVDPSAWFFAAHFFQDPVIPGSLGLESFVQLMKVLARRRWPDLVGTHRFEPIAVGRPHAWFYRGQVVPTDERVTVEAWVTAVEDGDAPVMTASGFLHVDGRTIYEMRDFALRLVPA